MTICDIISIVNYFPSVLSKIILNKGLLYEDSTTVELQLSEHDGTGGGSDN